MTESFTEVVPEDDAGTRLDAFLASRLRDEGFSRAIVQRAIRDGRVRVDGQVEGGAKRRLKAGEAVAADLVAPPADPEAIPVEAEAIDLDVVHEDDRIVVVAKQAGLTVHPGAGQASGTLANALRARWGADLSLVNGPSRPGIVHRLDRDTSGVIVVARDDRAHHVLAKQFEARTTEKEYLAIVEGSPPLEGGEVDLPIARHPAHRMKMLAVKPDRRVHPDRDPAERDRRPVRGARSALTRWRVEERIGRTTLLRVSILTGRTHQIRVHLAAIGLPVLCDAVYGRRAELRPHQVAALVARDAASFEASDPVPDEEPLLRRQALHAARLTFDHPGTGERVTFSAPLPDDMEATLRALRAAAA